MAIFESLWGGPFQESIFCFHFDPNSSVKNAVLITFNEKCCILVAQKSAVRKISALWESAKITLVKRAEIGTLGRRFIILLQKYQGEKCAKRHFG